MMRRYIASFDNGHDYFNIEFMSNSRAGSKQNKVDAVEALRAKKGSKVSRGAELISISRYDYK